MSKGLEFLKTIITTDELKPQLEQVKKELKALKIIKNKEVNMQVFNQCEDVETYNYVYKKQEERQLIKEEFELLKEVLCDD